MRMLKVDEASRLIRAETALPPSEKERGHLARKQMRRFRRNTPYHRFAFDERRKRSVNKAITQ
jgi:hypothetical protein